MGSATKTSRFLSLVLRHRPDKIGLTLDREGWVGVDELLLALRAHGHLIDRVFLEKVVAENDKKRFAFDDTGTRIRASQGHSVDIDLGLSPATPPETLFHGTVAKALFGIAKDGLRPMSRQHVHLSPDRQTASMVGQRRGAPLIFEVASSAMSRDGHVFFLSANGVWLTDKVPTRYLKNLPELQTNK